MACTRNSLAIGRCFVADRATCDLRSKALGKMPPLPFGEPEPSYPPAAKHHDFLLCPGNCRQHPGVIGDVVQTLQWMSNGASWGDIVYYESLEQEAVMTPQQKVARAVKQQEEQKARELDAQASEMFRYAEAQKLRNTVVKGKQRTTVKHQAPCKWLYVDEAAPKHNGKAPIRNYITGAQCWAFEYTDPRTKELKKPHTCGHLHPGEPGWMVEWEKGRQFKPADRFIALKR